MSRHERPYAGVDLAAARAQLAGLPARHLHPDWIAVDKIGHHAVFLGDERSPWPVGADAERTSRLVETIRAGFDRLNASVMMPAYRNPAHRAREPIFDLPSAGHGLHLHESVYSGYPHLVMASEGGGAAVRAAMTDLGGREALSRGPFAVVIDDLGALAHGALHEAGACAGCRVLDDPEDPRSRSPELLASVGLYVFGIVSDGSWNRVTSPGVPADADDLVAIGGAGVGTVGITCTFEETLVLGPDLAAAR